MGDDGRTTARRRATPSPPIIRVVQPLLEALQEPHTRRAEILQAQAAMSRGRFAVSQFTSVLVAFLTCLTLLLVAVLKMNSLQEVIGGPCGLFSLLLNQHNNSCPNSLANADTTQETVFTPPPSNTEYD